MHELLTLPQALTETNGRFRSGDVAQVLTSGIQCPPSIGTADLWETVKLIIDGQAIVCSFVKPPKAATFGDLADVFIGAVLQGGTLFKLNDVVFGRYYKKSIKERTRTRPGQSSVAI